MPIVFLPNDAPFSTDHRAENEKKGVVFWGRISGGSGYGLTPMTPQRGIHSDEKKCGLYRPWFSPRSFFKTNFKL